MWFCFKERPELKRGWVLQTRSEKFHWRWKSFNKEKIEKRTVKKLNFIETNSQDSCKEKGEVNEESCEKSEI